MMFLKFLCCKETALTATITTGEIKNLDSFKNPMLEVHIQLTMGEIIPSTDFLYLQPQLDQAPRDPHSQIMNKTANNANILGTAPSTATNTNYYGNTEKTHASTGSASNEKSMRLAPQNTTNTHGDASGTIQFGGPEDKEPLPRRLRDVQKERVIMMEKGSALCENVGLAYIDYMSLPKGRYKLYFMRIENEQRIMFNSRLGLLGSSSAFSVNNVVVITSKDQDEKQRRNHQRNNNVKDMLLGKGEEQSTFSQDSNKQLTSRKIHHDNIDGFNDSSDLDSMSLMNQMMQGQFMGPDRPSLSMTQSVHSSDQTQMLSLSPNNKNRNPNTNITSQSDQNNLSCYNAKLSNQKGGNLLQYTSGSSRDDQQLLKSNNSQANSSSQFSCGSSTVTYMVRNENDEAMIVTQSQKVANPGQSINNSQNNSCHRRGINIQSVLEDISNSRYAVSEGLKKSNKTIDIKNAKSNLPFGNNSTRKNASKSKIAQISLSGGKENKRNGDMILSPQQFLNSRKSGGFMRNSAKNLQQIENNYTNLDAHHFYERESYDAEHNLNIRYVNDIESFIPPRYNPDTRTYFKCSIYSPSNRLFTVNEEVNSTQSEIGAVEQFSSSSLLNSGLRKSNQRGTTGKFVHHGLRSSGSIPFPDRIIEDFSLNGGRSTNHQIDEEDENDDDTGNVSETMATTLPNSHQSQTPLTNLRVDLKSHNTIFIENNQKQLLMGFSSQPSTSGGHTRTNSSKAQSLKGSIILQKPALSSQFSSIVLNQNQLAQNNNPYGISNKPQSYFNTGSHHSQNLLVIPSSNESRQSTLRQGAIHTNCMISPTNIQSTTQNHHFIKKTELSKDIDLYMQQMPGSFVCTGGTEFQYESNNGNNNGNRDEEEKHNSNNNRTHESIKSQGGSAKKSCGLSIEKTVIKHSSCSNEESKSSISFLNEDSGSPNSPLAFFDETNRKVLIISSDPTQNNNQHQQQSHNSQNDSKIQHCIEWEEDTDPKIIGKAIEQVLEKVKSAKKQQDQDKSVQNNKMFKKNITPIKSSKIINGQYYTSKNGLAASQRLQNEIAARKKLYK